MKLDPIPPLDEQHPLRLPTLPQWLMTLLASLKKETQADQSGKYREVYVLPSNLTLKPVQRTAIENHVSALNEAIQMTPSNDPRSAARTRAAISKMMLALALKPIEDLSAEAKFEAYIIALSDVSCWAVEEVICNWYSGKYKGEHNPRWIPDPATFRELACGEELEVRYRARRLQILLQAETAVEFSEDHRQRMLALLTGLSSFLKRNI